MPRRCAILGFGLAAVAGAAGACTSGPKASFDSPDPLERTLALAQTARQTGLSDEQMRHLIASLDSIDPAERLLAIRTLERETGETMGYRHYDPERLRAPAVARWVDWWSARVGPACGNTGGEEG